MNFQLVAIKRAKKGSATNIKKSEDNDETPIQSTEEVIEGVTDNIEKGNEESKAESKKDEVKDEKIERKYKTYDVDIEFKLKEIFSKDNKILIGPPRLTRFEKARITGARSLQLSLGAPILIKIPLELTDTIMIAKYELEKKALPISIRRILPNGHFQDIPIDWTT